MAKKKAKRSKARQKPPTKNAKPHRTDSRILHSVRRKLAVSLCRLIGQPGFLEFLDGVKDIVSCLPLEEQEKWAAALKAQLSVAQQRRENGETLASEGTAANAARARQTTTQVCRLYRIIRPAFPTGRAGNGDAIREVASRHQHSSGREKPLTVQAIRNILKRGGTKCF
jgi:hypothetical protein